MFSRTLKQAGHPGMTFITGEPSDTVEALKAEPRKDIWIFGGGLLFRSLLEAGLVDTVEVAILPVLLGGGTPLLPSPARLTTLGMKGHRVYKSGMGSLEYDVRR